MCLLLSQIWLFVTPQTVVCQAPLSMGYFPIKNIGVGCYFLLQTIFLTQGLNPHFLCLLHCRWILYCWATWEACSCILSCFAYVKLIENLCTIAYQAPLSRVFSRQEYCSGLPFPSPGHLPDRKIEPTPTALADGLYNTEMPGKPRLYKCELFIEIDSILIHREALLFDIIEAK